MQYFKNSSHNVFAFESDVTIEQINAMQPDLTSITEDEANTITHPSEAEILQAAKDNRIAYMKGRCDAEIIGGISSIALGTIHNYDTREVDQLNWEHALSQAITNTNPENGQPGHDPELPLMNEGWVTCNDPSGSLGYLKRGHTEVEIHTVRSDFLVHKYTKTDRLQTKIAAITSATTETAVNAVEW